MSTIPSSSSISPYATTFNGPRAIWAYSGATGTQGPTGAQGPTGTQGPTGPSGGAGTITVLQAETAGNIVYDATASRAAGTYQLQLGVETPVAGSQALAVFATVPPSTNVVNFSGVEVVPASVGANLLCMVSGTFTHPGGNMRVQVLTGGTAWTGTWSMQLIQLS